MTFMCRISFRLLQLHLHAFEIGELALLGRQPLRMEERG
jgi:hypothetical protein